MKHELRPEPGLQHLMKMIFSNFVTFIMILTQLFTKCLSDVVPWLLPQQSREVIPDRERGLGNRSLIPGEV